MELPFGGTRPVGAWARKGISRRFYAFTASRPWPRHGWMKGQAGQDVPRVGHLLTQVESRACQRRFPFIVCQDSAQDHGRPPPRRLGFPYQVDGSICALASFRPFSCFVGTGRAGGSVFGRAATTSQLQRRAGTISTHQVPGNFASPRAHRRLWRRAGGRAGELVMGPHVGPACVPLRA